MAYAKMSLFACVLVTIIYTDDRTRGRYTMVRLFTTKNVKFKIVIILSTPSQSILSHFPDYARYSWTSS